MLAIVGALVAGYYFAMRPVTLRIAVGPANSDDLKVVQALAQAFNNQPTAWSGCARCRPTVRWQAPTCSAKARPTSPSSEATSTYRRMRRPWRRCARTSRCCGCRRPARSRARRPRPQITKISAARRTPHRRRRPHPGQCQSAQGDPAAIRRRSGKVEIIQFPANEAAEAIRNQKADAYLAAGPVNSKITADAIAASARDGGTPKFLAIDSAEAIAQNHPAYEASEIPAGTFGGSPNKPEEEVKTISFAHHIVARKGVSESTIAAFTRQLFAIRQTLKTEFPLAAKIETPDTDKDATIPVHPGAAAFVDGEEKTFLDRYSDYIWWALMALSAMGSAGAWFAGYLKKDERNINTSQRDRLLDMLTAARQCDSTEELDQMQSEADAILRDTLQCFEHGAIEEGTLTAFNIAIEQFHNAVADRKALLMSMPQNLQRASAQFRAAGTA